MAQRVRKTKAVETYYKIKEMMVEDVGYLKNQETYIVEIGSSARKCHRCGDKMLKHCYGTIVYISGMSQIPVACPHCTRKRIKSFLTGQASLLQDSMTANQREYHQQHYDKWKTLEDKYNVLVDQDYVNLACKGCTNAAKCLTKLINQS